MSTTSNRLPLSTPNIVIIGLSFFGTVLCHILGNIPGALLLAVVLISILISAVLARRDGASDWLRVNAIEYRDERDSRLAAQGFAVVGAWALALATLQLVAATIFAGAVGFTTSSGSDGSTTFSMHGILALALGLELVTAIQLLVLAIVWAVANTRAVRRG